MSELVGQLCEALAATGIAVDGDADACTLTIGRGLRKRQCTLDLTQLAGEHIHCDADLLAFTRGVERAMNEPARGRGADLDFVSAAALITPSLERDAFVAAHNAARGEPLFTRPSFPGTQLTYYLELDAGIRVLPTSQVDRWGVHAERVYKAALSILFHRTGWRKPEADGDAAPCLLTIRVGDGYDAARALIIEMVDYDNSRGKMWVAVPEPTTLLFTTDPQDGVVALERRTKEIFGASSTPLSSSIYEFVDGVAQDIPA